MSKKISAIALLASLFPQVALAHFETSHQTFWHLPMHWLTQHYFGTLIVGLSLLAVYVHAKKQSDEQ